MRRLALGFCVLAVSLAAAGSAHAASRQGLDMYTAKADAKSLAAIHSGGYDVAESHLGGGDRVDLVLTAREAQGLRARGVDVSLKRNGKGQTVRQQAARWRRPASRLPLLRRARRHPRRAVRDREEYPRSSSSR